MMFNNGSNASVASGHSGSTKKSEASWFPLWRSGSSEQQQQPRTPTSPMISSSNIGGITIDSFVDEPESSVMASAMTEDEVVERLLTQFPTYGSHQKAAAAEQHKKGGVAHEWWMLPVVGGGGGAAAANSIPEEEKDELGILEDSPSMKTAVVGNHHENSMPTRVEIPSEQWDLDEQNLWKSSPTAAAVEANDATIDDSPIGFGSKRFGTFSTARNHQELGSTAWSPKDAAPTTPSSWSQSVARRRQQQQPTAPNVISASSRPPTWMTTSAGSACTTVVPPPSSPPPPPASTTTVSIRDDRQHWMPDRLCKQCYSCDTPFTVFRRRHHCRLCGQVFCNACSAHFVAATTCLPTGTAIAETETTPAVTTSMIRVCQMCNDQVAQRGGLVVQQQQSITLAGQQPLSPTSSTKTKLYTNGALFSPRQSRQPSTSLTLFTSAAPAVSNYQDHLTESLRGGVDQGESILTALCRQQQQRAALADGGGGAAASADEESEVSASAVASPTSSSNNRRAAAAAARIPTTAPLTPRSRTMDVNKPSALSERVISSSSAAKQKRNSAKATQQKLQKEGHRHLGLTAANHMEVVIEDLLKMHAPLLWKQFEPPAAAAPEKAGENENKQNEEQESTDDQTGATAAPAEGEKARKQRERLKSDWINKLLSLATRCCATVDPNIKRGDLLDIRPYCKIKVIPGGSYTDCAYISGVVFRKTVSHKRMAKELLNPRIMLLSGGIEFTRKENRIASLETLFEQEEKYMEILVGKILKLQPDLLLVGRSVSRIAQELLLKAGVVLIQHVKATLLSRISRQTGATVISSTDHVMNQFGAHVLGKCFRFRLAAFRDNERWVDEPVVENDHQDSSKPAPRRCIQQWLANPELKNHERQAALAASQLGEGVLDGSEAVKTGLAKRGVAQTYLMIEGCPKQLGCTVVLRGAARAALKQVKLVFRFMINVAYNLRLETSFLRERGARIRPDFEENSRFAHSSSMCVDFGNAPNKKLRPWNGGQIEPSAPSASSGSSKPPICSEITALDHQAILVTSVWMTGKTQCCPAEVKGICYYSIQDVALGQFLRDSCFNLSLKCQNPNCKKSVLDHSLSFVHNDGLINITVEELDEDLPPSPHDNSNDGEGKEVDHFQPGLDESLEDGEDVDRPIATWTQCKICRKVVTPLVYISDSTWKFSFGKFLEIFFYNRDAVMNASELHSCPCKVQSDTRLFFGCGKLAASFTYEPIRPYGVFVRRTLPMELLFQKEEALRRLDLISNASSKLFIKFDKHIARVSREARSLFNSPANRPEHLQTVLSELNAIGSEVDQTAKTLQAKIASVSDNFQSPELVSGDAPKDSVTEALFRYPWSARRYLFTLTSAWNEKLSAIGAAITAMKKLAASSSSGRDGLVGPNIGGSAGEPLNEELMESLKRLRKLNDHYSRYNASDITQVLPSVHGPAGMLQQDGDYEDDFDAEHGAGGDTSIDFSDGVDADVLASRRRLLKGSGVTSSQLSDRSSRVRPTKSLGTSRAGRPDPSSSRSTSGKDPSPPRPTPGGAVKSAITRFFNRGGRDADAYTVDLGIFAQGRPRLALGVNGMIVPVHDEQLSTIIAYSLASTEYAKQFKHYSKASSNEVLSSATSGDMMDATSDRSRASGQGSSNDHKSSGSDHQGGSAHRRRPSTLSDATADPTTSTATPTSATTLPQLPATPTSRATDSVAEQIERRMLVRSKSHIKHTFRDFDEKGQVTCKFVCTSYWATQFQVVREVFLSQSPPPSHGGKTDFQHDGSASDWQSATEAEQCYIESLSCAFSWAASGGKSGASFARTSDDRFVIKCISRTELQMFLDCAPAYFEYLSKAFFHGLPTALCKIVGVYQIGVHNRITGKRSMEQVAVMQNIFYNRKVTKVFDLKGSQRGRFAARLRSATKEDPPDSQNLSMDASSSSAKSSGRPSDGGIDDRKHDSEATSGVGRGSKFLNEKKNGAISSSGGEDDDAEPGTGTLLDGDFLEFTAGRPMPLADRARAVFQMSILNDTLFLSIINVLDYSILIGVDEENMELVVGIIDFMRQYDILKQMERVGKSLPMVVGSEAPTIIQPPLYKARFTHAMDRYFMNVPSKWTQV